MSETEKALDKLREAEARRKTARESQKAIDAEYSERSLEFALSIRGARLKANISTSRFAKTLGCSAPMVSLMEAGERLWTVEAAEKAVEAVR